MAKFFLHQGVVCLRKSAAEEAGPMAVPPDATDIIEFDERTNTAVIAAFNADCNSHTLIAGVLRKNGQVVNFSADSSDGADRREFDDQLATYYAAMQNYLAIADTATNAQVRDQVKRLTQGMVRLCKIISQLRPLLEK